MRVLKRVAGVGLVLFLSVSAAGCSDWPDGPANPGTVRVYTGDSFKTWQLAPCQTADDTSLSVTGSDAMGGRVVIQVEGGTGDITVFDGTSVTMTGDVVEYQMDAEQLFTAKGDYQRGEDSGKLKLDGNCSSAIPGQ